MSDPGRRVAVVTGASRGIGAGIVEAYRAEGWGVVANSRSIAPASGAEVVSVAGDIADPATAEHIVEKALEHFGRIDTLVNNAGLFISKPFSDYTDDDFSLLVSVNLTGFFRVTQRVVREMEIRGGGHIVNLTTMLVDYADSAVPSALVALTKGGLTAVTRSLAIEYAGRGVRVNALSLGVIQTPDFPPGSYDAEAKREPLGRVGQISDVVRGILFLEASPYVTGEILHIDGGKTAGH
jgi:NAD(P)-dependent dehydrogenase (short-subunit alcohol dehydrogenase family)